MNSLILFTLLFVSVALAQPLHRFTSNGEYSGVLSRMIEPDEPSQSLALWVPFNVKNIAVSFSDPVDSHNYVPYIQFNSRKCNLLYVYLFYLAGCEYNDGQNYNHMCGESGDGIETSFFIAGGTFNYPLDTNEWVWPLNQWVYPTVYQNYDYKSTTKYTVSVKYYCKFT